MEVLMSMRGESMLSQYRNKYMPKEMAAGVAKNKALQEKQEVPALLTTLTPVAAAMSSSPPSQPMKKGASSCSELRNQCLIVYSIAIEISIYEVSYEMYHFHRVHDHPILMAS